MLYDLGIVEGSAPHRHETFRAHYPEGYRMTFVSGENALIDPGLKAAIAKNQAKQSESEDQ